MNQNEVAFDLIQNFPKRTLTDSIWPVLNCRVIDSFEYRNDDVIVDTYAKSGTTWVLQIVDQLKRKGQDEQMPHFKSTVWIEHGLMSTEEKLKQLNEMKSPRLLKSHLPLNALNYSPNVKYIYIVRHIGDVALSMYNHFASFTQMGRDCIKWGNQMSFDEYYPIFINGQYPFWPLCEHVKSWWDYKHLHNILLLHYDDLKNDLRGQIKKISEFLDYPVNDDELSFVIEHSTFDYMKANEYLFEPPPSIMEPGHFIYKGITCRWKQVLTQQQKNDFEKICREKWSDECRNWVNRE